MGNPSYAHVEDTEHWRITSQPVRELGYDRTEWAFSRTLALPSSGLISVVAKEVAKVLDGTCFGICGFLDFTQKPDHPGPKSEIAQDQNIYAQLLLYRAVFMINRGLVIQDDFARVQAYGLDPNDVSLKGYINIKHSLTDPTSPAWQLIEKIDKMRIQS